jgi:CheY-like chemotaxis protein
MSLVVLVHWHEAECRERQRRLEGYGHEVFAHWRQDRGGELTRQLRRAPPAAVVIDLSRLPSHGRSVASWLRETKAVRRVPIVCVPGDPDKTDRMKQAFPDAVYAPWSRMKSSLQRAIDQLPKDPVVPKAADYSGTPLPKKLGVKAGSVLAVQRAPADWRQTLGELPEGASHKRGLRGERDVVVLFCRALAELRRDWPAAEACLADGGSLWVAWPKKASGVTTDLSDGVVRAFGLDQGLVDTKVCAIDATWSGLRFSRRRAARR